MNLPTLTPWHEEALGAAMLGGLGDSNWTSNNRAYSVPFSLTEPTSFLGGFVWNGANATGNFDIAVYDADDLARLISLGSTARSGTNVLQTAAFGATLNLFPGPYHMAIVLSSTTGTVQRATPDANHLKTLGVKQMDSALPLPDPFVPALMASGFLPFFGLYRIAP